MVFSSSFFLFAFLPFCLLINAALRATGNIPAQNIFLLAVSMFFYAFGEIYYVFIMVFSIVLNYAFGFGVAMFRGKLQSAFLAVGVIANLLVLTYYKYFNFLIDNLNGVISTFGVPELANDPVHLPIGISFFTFQAISYLVDIYRGDAKLQKNPLYLGLYISLFPQLIAGPIVRYSMVDEEIRSRTITLDAYVTGIRLFCVGLFMKVAIADTMAGVVDGALSNAPIADFGTGLAWLVMVGYSLQIFFDFAGYSLMALGLGRLFGFTFPVNFNQPYISTSIREFWRRWHISLSTWFRDYLYIPLGGSRGSELTVYRNLLIVFFVTGLWHGASWNFVIWGLWHGLFIVLERDSRIGGFLDQLPFLLKRIYLLLVVIIGWVFFRVETLPDALTMLNRMFIPQFGPAPSVLSDPRYYLDGWVLTILALAVIWAFISPERGRWITATIRRRSELGAEVGLLLGSMALFAIAASLVIAGSYTAFIYFRF